MIAGSARTARPRGVTASLARRRALSWMLLPAAGLVVPGGVGERRADRVGAGLAGAGVHAADPRGARADRAPAAAAQGSAPDRARPRRRRAHRRARATARRASSADDPYIAGIRFGRKAPDVLRVVIDLRGEVTPQLFALKPVAEFGHRVVLDLYPQNPVDPLMALLEETRAPPAARRGRPSAKPTRAPRPTPAARPGAPRRITIALDPGHGGEDPGAVGRRGTYEKNVVLAIARKLKTMIDAEPGMRAMLTRDDDYYVPLAQRVQKARRVRADLFVSIHADAFKVPTARGSSVFALSENGATSAAANWLAQKENAADLIGGVNLDVRDPVLARTLLDLSQAAQINDSLKVGRHVLDGIRQVQPAAQAVRRAGRLRRAEGAGHPVDPGRDRVHLQSRRGAEAARATAHQTQLRRVDPRRASAATSRRTPRWRGSADGPPAVAAAGAPDGCGRIGRDAALLSSCSCCCRRLLFGAELTPWAQRVRSSCPGPTRWRGCPTVAGHAVRSRRRRHRQGDPQHRQRLRRVDRGRLQRRRGDDRAAGGDARLPRAVEEPADRARRRRRRRPGAQRRPGDQPVLPRAVELRGVRVRAPLRLAGADHARRAGRLADLGAHAAAADDGDGAGRRPPPRPRRP